MQCSLQVGAEEEEFRFVFYSRFRGAQLGFYAFDVVVTLSGKVAHGAVDVRYAVAPVVRDFESSAPSRRDEIREYHLAFNFPAGIGLPSFDVFAVVLVKSRERVEHLQNAVFEERI